MTMQEELAALITRCQERKVAAFDNLKMFTRGNLTSQVAGYKSIEDAAVKIIADALKANEKDMQAFERKYP